MDCGESRFDDDWKSNENDIFSNLIAFWEKKLTICAGRMHKFSLGNAVKSPGRMCYAAVISALL